MRIQSVPFFADDPRPFAALGVVLAIYLLRRYWLVPIRLLQNQFPIGESAPRLVGSDAELPAEAKEVLARFRDELGRLGFTQTPAIVDSGKTARLYLQRYEDASLTTVATVTASFRVRDGAIVSLFRAHVGYESRGPTGNKVLTIGHGGASGFPDKPKDSVVRIPEEDAAMLLKIHVAHLKHAKVKPIQHRVGDPVAYQCRISADSERWAIESGWFQNVNGYRKRTLRGALIVTWRELPPWSWIIRRRKSRLWQALLAEAMGVNTILGVLGALQATARSGASAQR